MTATGVNRLYGVILQKYRINHLKRSMQNIPDDVQARLIAALEDSDANRRAGRAERIMWLSVHEFSPGVVAGRADTLALMREARETFVDGHFIAALVLAMGFIEHTIVENILDHGLAKPATLHAAIKTCRDHLLFRADWLNRADKLRLHRNPFAHFTAEDKEHTLVSRYKNQKAHPATVLEADAKEALALLYLYFRDTLNTA